MLEHVVVRGEGGRGQDGAEDGVGSVVERVGGNHGSPVDVAGQDELNFRSPLFDSFGFRLGSLVVLLEVIRKVAIQVKSTGIIPKN